MPNLRPFRDYDEKDVINFYAASGAAIPINKGTLYKIAGAGLKTDNENPIEQMGSYGGFTEPNTVSTRWGVVPKITPISASTDAVVGMSLFDVREVDENGELLKYNPRKAAEMEAVLSGQAVPLVTRGIFAYSGVETGNGIVASVTAGTLLYPSSTAGLTSAGTTLSVVTGNGSTLVTAGRAIATALGDTATGNNTTIILLHIK